jgi:DNA-binding NarL/FixJ family response regulator
MKHNLYTPRELQVLQVCWEQEGDLTFTGEVLGISSNTVRVHLANIGKKMGTSGRGRAATLVRAHQDGLVR